MYEDLFKNFLTLEKQTAEEQIDTAEDNLNEEDERMAEQEVDQLNQDISESDETVAGMEGMLTDILMMPIQAIFEYQKFFCKLGYRRAKKKMLEGVDKYILFQVVLYVEKIDWSHWKINQAVLECMAPGKKSLKRFKYSKFNKQPIERERYVFVGPTTENMAKALGIHVRNIAFAAKKKGELPEKYEDLVEVPAEVLRDIRNGETFHDNFHKAVAMAQGYGGLESMSTIPYDDDQFEYVAMEDFQDDGQPDPFEIIDESSPDDDEIAAPDAAELLGADWLFDTDLKNMDPFRFGMPSNEAIDFQLQSKVGQKLTQCFQKVIDFRDNLDYSKVRDTHYDRREYRIKEVVAYFRSKAAPEMMQIIEAETGLKIEKLYSVAQSSGPIGFFACDITFGAGYSALDIADQMAGTGGNFTFGRPEIIEDLMTLSDCVDLKNSKVFKKTYGVRTKRPVATKMYFDILTAFCIEDYVPKKVATNMTAREIAAIMMHEIGHAFVIMEHARNTFAVTTRLSDYIKDIKQEKNPKDVVSKLAAVMPQIIKESKKWNLDGEDAKIVSKLLSALNTATASMKQYVEKDAEREGYLFTLGSYICTVVGLWLSFMFILLQNVILLGLGLTLIYEIQRLGYADSNRLGNKAGDIKGSGANLYWHERLADEFALRHGFGPDLGSSLIKLYAVCDAMSITGTTSSARLRNSTAFALFLKLHFWVFDKINLLAYLEPVIYENNYNRLVRLAQNSYAFFREHKEIEGEARDHWIMNAEMALENAKKIKSTSDTALAKAFYNVVRNLTSPVKWIVNFNDLNLARDVEILVNRIDDLKVNRLYFLSAKFDSMANRV